MGLVFVIFLRDGPARTSASPSQASSHDEKGEKKKTEIKQNKQQMGQNASLLGL